MKTCKTCNGPLLFWNPERYNYRQVIALLNKAREAGRQQLPKGIYTLNEAVNCQQCASKLNSPLKRRNYFGRGQSHA